MNLKLDKLSSREQIGLMVAGFAIFLALLNGLVIDKIVSRLTLLDSLIERSQKHLDLSAKVIRSRSSVEAEYERVKSMFEQVDTVNAGKENINSMMDELAKKHSVNCASMEALEPDPGKSLNYDVFELNVSQFDSSTANLLTFLHEMNEQRKLPGMPRVSKMTLSTVKNSDQIKGSMLITKIMTKVAVPAAEKQASGEETK